MNSFYESIVRKGFQLPFFLRHLTLDPACAPLFKIFVSPPLFSVPPAFKVFQTVPSTLTQPSPPCPNPTYELPFT